MAGITDNDPGATAPTSVTGAAGGRRSDRATLHGAVKGNGGNSVVTFEYGATTSYGSTIAAEPSAVVGSGEAPVQAALLELTPGATYHFRTRAQNAQGISYGADQTFVAANPPTPVPDVLRRVLRATGNPQSGSQQGYSCAIDGNLAVVGLPYADDVAPDDAGPDTGLVRVYDATTGEVLHTLPNPSPTTSDNLDNFGFSVAISGTRVVVSAPRDDTGASDTGCAYVFDLATATPTVPVATLYNPFPESSDNFGWSVAISGDRVVAGCHLDNAGATDAGSAYVYQLNSTRDGAPIAILNNPAPEVDDRFGYAVAISGTRAVVGAYRDNAGANDAGTAYVYDVAATAAPVLLAVLSNPTPEDSDRFGSAVAISGTLVLIGADGDNTGGDSAGSAYLYDLGGATPGLPTATLNNPSPAAGDGFGVQVAISGTRAIVGASGDDALASDSGAAHLYQIAGGIPGAPLTLENPSPGTGDSFGRSVGISGMRAVVGANFDDSAAADAGSAYSYDLSAGTPAVPVATLRHPAPIGGDRFGVAMAVSGRWLVVGAPNDDTGASNAGAAHVYDFTSAEPGGPAFVLRNPSPATDDGFGTSVAVWGDVVVVGAPRDNTGAADAGSAYLFDLAGTSPTVPALTLNNPAPGSGDGFGSSVAIEEMRVVVGAEGDDTAGTDAGSAYAYDLDIATPATPVVVMNNPSPSGDDSFGSSMAISGGRVAIAAVSDDLGAVTNAGSAYVYDLAGASPSVPVATLPNPSPAAGDSFGYSIGISGNYVVVGAIADDTGAADAGSAYVFNLASPAPATPMLVLNNPAPTAGDNFGHGVAISGSRIAVGATNDGTAAAGTGSVYLYDLSWPTPSAPAGMVTNPSPDADDDFGLAVALDGLTLAVGAPYDDATAADKGAAYIFHPSALAPEMTTDAAGDITTVTATLSGTVNAMGTPAAVSFQYGLDASYGSTVAAAPALVGGATPVPVAASLSGLSPGVTYHFRMVATNSAGTTFGSDAIFTTLDLDADDDGPLDSWELTYWPTLAGHSALDDFDHDGLTELQELGFGGNPTVPDRHLAPDVVNEGGYLTVTITRQAGVTYEVESAGTLAEGQADSFHTSSTTTLIDNATTLKVCDNFPAGASPARFLRVKVIAAP